MASFNDFSNNVYRSDIFDRNQNMNNLFFSRLFSDTVSICLVTWFTSIFGGFAIFTVLGMQLIVGKIKGLIC